MKSTIILWIQSKCAKDSDILSVDGIRIENTSKKFDNYASMALDVKREYQLLKKGNNLSIYKISKNTYLIFSNFNEVDEVDRKIGFMSYIKTDKDPLALLQKEAQLYGYTLDDNDKKLIDSYTKQKNKVLVSLILTTLLLTLIFCLLLWKII